jgi:hypothetical protein
MSARLNDDLKLDIDYRRAPREHNTVYGEKMVKKPRKHEANWEKS